MSVFVSMQQVQILWIIVYKNFGIDRLRQPVKTILLHSGVLVRSLSTAILFMKYKVCNEHTVDYRLNPSSSCFTNNFPSACHNKRKKKRLKPSHIEYKVSTFLYSNLTHKKQKNNSEHNLNLNPGSTQPY